MERELKNVRRASLKGRHIAVSIKDVENPQSPF